LAVIIALSMGGSLAGILGALVAVPTAAVAAVLVDEYLVKPHRNEPAPTVAGTYSAR
jgi:predicted PurR-regulated permease PerM